MLALPLRGLTPELYHGKYVAGMFGSGEQGAWFDPSDFSTMFQDAAGTTPVTGMEQPVGLILDKSKGAIRNNGATAYNFLFYTEEITNAYWVPTAVSKSATTAPDETNTAVKVAAIAVNTQHHVLPTPEPIIPAGNPVLKYSFYAKAEGYRYLGIWGFNALSYFDLIDGVVVSKSVDHISATITKLSGGWNYIDIRFVRYNPNSYRIYTIETPGVHAFLGDGVSGCSIWHPDLRLESNADAQPVYQPIGSGTWLSQIPGNHATQTTTASRPVLSARVNLLEKTENFADSYWGNYSINVSISSDQVMSPDGLMTADKVVATNVSAYHIVKSKTLSVIAGITYTSVIYAKAAEYKKIRISCIANLPDAVFDLSSVTCLGYLGTTASINDVGNGWYKCTATRTAPASSSTEQFFIVLTNNSGQIVFEGDGTSGIYIWGADLRVANESSLLPPYQRVNTATDYDTAGFPYYLSFDGVDDFLVTPSIDFTGTDKMTVFTADHSVYDNPTGPRAIVGLSTSVFGYNGTWWLTAYDSVYNARSVAYLRGNLRGAGVYGPDQITLGVRRLVRSFRFDISKDLLANETLIRLNGVPTPLTSTPLDPSAGSGNFGNWPLYIGRVGSQYPFNGRLYGLIVRGAQTDDDHLTHAEKFLAYKSGVTL